MRDRELSWDLLVQGVYIVAAAHERRRAALALSYATQVAEERILLVIGRQSYTRELILASGAFGLTVLAPDQVDLAADFGNCSSREIDKLAKVPYHTRVTGSPLLDDGVLTLDCRVAAAYDDAEGAKLILGQVMVAETLRDGARPLVLRHSDFW
ncbi:MAG: flavin reductase [Armatimonadetes bacterium]|nr:flavin reductase [Armatimonadota bacterium]